MRQRKWEGYARSCKDDEHPFIFGITQLAKTKDKVDYYEEFKCCSIKKVRIIMEEL